MVVYKDMLFRKEFPPPSSSDADVSAKKKKRVRKLRSNKLGRRGHLPGGRQVQQMQDTMSQMI